MASVLDSNEKTKICRDMSIDSNYNSFGPWNCYDDFSTYFDIFVSGLWILLFRYLFPENLHFVTILILFQMTTSFLNWWAKPKQLLRLVFIRPEYTKAAVEAILWKIPKGKLLESSNQKMKNHTEDWIPNGRSFGIGRCWNKHIEVELSVFLLNLLMFLK